VNVIRLFGVMKRKNNFADEMRFAVLNRFVHRRARMLIPPAMKFTSV